MRFGAVFMVGLLLAASSESLPWNYASVVRHGGDDCICLEGNTHATNSAGQIVSGQYSYLDPLGSRVTVTYTNGLDGYQEKRRIEKNYGQVTVTEVVTEVLEDLQGQVLTAIEVVLNSPEIGQSTSTSTIVSR